MKDKESLALSAPWLRGRIVSFPGAAWAIGKRVEEDTSFGNDGVQLGYRVADTAVGELELVATPRAAVSLVFNGCKFPMVCMWLGASWALDGNNLQPCDFCFKKGLQAFLRLMFVASFLQPPFHSTPLVLGCDDFVADGVLALAPDNVRQCSHADKLWPFHNCAGQVVHGRGIVGIVQTHAVNDRISVIASSLV